MFKSFINLFTFQFLFVRRIIKFFAYFSKTLINHSFIKSINLCINVDKYYFKILYSCLLTTDTEISGKLLQLTNRVIHKKSV